MPTDKQLFEIWSAQLRFFGGSGVPNQSNQSHDGFGTTILQSTDIPPDSEDDEDFDEDIFDDELELGIINFDPNKMELNVTFDTQ